MAILTASSPKQQLPGPARAGRRGISDRDGSPHRLACRSGQPRPKQRPCSLDAIGVTLLRTIDPTLSGAGVRIAQSKAGTTSVWEVDPANVGLPASRFTWHSEAGYRQ